MTYMEGWLVLMWIATAFNICSGVNTYLNMRRLKKRAHRYDEIFTGLVKSMKAEKLEVEKILEQLKLCPENKE